MPVSGDWSVLLQFPKNTVGSFQLWNARFFNFYRNNDSLNVLIHKKWWESDTVNEDSFTIIADGLNTDEIRKS